MKKLVLVTCLSSLLCASSILAAWNRPNAVTLNFADAYYHFDSKRHADNSAMPNLAIDYNFDERWAAELGFGVMNTNYHDTTGLRAVLYTFDGIYRFMSKGRFEPYVIAGIGALGMKPSIGTQAQYQGNVNAGIGTQFFADRMVALRVEARDLYTMSGGKNDYMINFGISFQFGGNSEPAPVYKT